MSRFSPDPLAFFNSIYQETPPWDIGGPQPAMSALLARYPPSDAVLDVGCGSGDLAIYLAQLGHQVLGIDFAEAAIAQARAKISLLPDETAHLLKFQVADALKLTSLQQQFGSVVDSGFFHLLEPNQRDPYIDELGKTLRPGGRYYLHAFAIEFPVPNTPRRVSADELQACFPSGKGWHIQEIQSVEFLTRFSPPVPAICACMERLPAQQA